MSAQNIGTATLATSLDALDRFAMWDSTTGAWRPANVATMRDLLYSRTVSLGDFASGGSIGSAATTVDIADAILINQTTAAKALTFATPTVNEFRKLVVANVGTEGFYAYGRFIRPGSSHEFVYIPSVGWRRTSSSPQIIAQSAVAVTAPADTNENTLATITIPGGVIGANGRLVVEAYFNVTASTNSKTWRVRLGGTSLHNGVTTSATAVSVGTLAPIANRNSESSQVGVGYTGNGVSSAALPTGTVDTTADQTLTITGQKATGAETMTLTQYSVRLERFD